MTKNAKQIVTSAVVLVVVGTWIVHFHADWITPRAPQWVASLISHVAEAPAGGEVDSGSMDPNATEVPVHVAQVSRATLHRYVEGFGIIAPRPARNGQQAGGAAIASSAAGVVAKVLCQIGQTVKQGDVLIQLDDRAAVAAEDQAAAALVEAQAALAGLKATPRPEQLDIARLAVERSQTALGFAQKTYGRQKQLAAEQNTSDKSVEQAALDLATAQNDLAVSEKQLTLLENSPTPEELAEENAKVAQAQAALAAAEAQRQVLSITSPIDGTIAQVNINAGEAVDTTRTLVEVIAMDRLMVDVDVPAEELSALAEGMSVIVLPDKAAAANAADEAAATDQAKISYISPKVDPKTGTVQIGIDLPPGQNLRPGLAVRVRIVAETHADRLAVPKQSVVTDDDGNTIVCLDDGDHAKQVKVAVGIQEGNLTEITSDEIKAGDSVITAGAYGLPDGAKISVADDSGKDKN